MVCPPSRAEDPRFFVIFFGPVNVAVHLRDGTGALTDSIVVDPAVLMRKQGGESRKNLKPVVTCGFGPVCLFRFGAPFCI